MNDVRDEVLGATLDLVARSLDAEPVDRLPEVVRWGSRRRAARFAVIGTTVAVFVGAISWAGLAIREDQTIPADVGDWRTFASIEENGWTVQVPPSWKVQELPSCPDAPERLGVIVTNTDFEFLNPRGESPECEDRFVFKGFPSDGVALAFMPVGTRYGAIQPEPHTAFPLTSDRLRRTSSLSGGASERFLEVGVKGELFAYVRRWVGPDAEPGDVNALDRLLSSLRLTETPWILTGASVLGSQVEMRHPSSFDVKRYRYPLVIDAPAPMLRLASPGVESGLCGPAYWRSLDIGFDDLGREGVVLVVSDATEAWSPDYDPRPQRFEPATATEHGRLICDRGTFLLLVFRFEESGRQIVLEVAMTREAMADQGSPFWRILDSIRVSRN